MDEKMVTFKVAIVGFLTACGAALGWQGIMAIVWIAVMLLDVISGMAAACKRGEWSSAVARQGVWHKVGMILVVIVAVLADLLLWEICSNVALGQFIIWSEDGKVVCRGFVQEFLLPFTHFVSSPTHHGSVIHGQGSVWNH